MEGMMRAHMLVAGAASGRVLASHEPLSFWGGYDAATGEIIDRRHPLSGCIASGCILALPATRGSSTSTAVLLESVRRNTAPAAVIACGSDTFLTLASIVADELYGKAFPVASLSEGDFCALRSGQWARLDEEGRITLSDRTPS